MFLGLKTAFARPEGRSFSCQGPSFVSIGRSGMSNVRAERWNVVEKAASVLPVPRLEPGDRRLLSPIPVSGVRAVNHVHPTKGDLDLEAAILDCQLFSAVDVRRRPDLPSGRHGGSRRTLLDVQQKHK